jgi:NAD(P)H-hydrate repair Nnr-like enzyme with NAD(P)H-hydrate dehydratase domain
LATSGSGDILAGLIAGLAARGTPLEQAAVWGVALHARAGEQLAARMGGLGFLARELAAEIPHLMDTGT